MSFRNDKYTYDAGWEKESHHTSTWRYTPKRPSSSLGIQSFEIHKREDGRFSCTIWPSNQPPQTQKFVTIYISQGGSKENIGDTLSGNKIFSEKTAEEIGLLLQKLTSLIRQGFQRKFIEFY